MAGLNVNDIVEFRLQGRLFGQLTLNTFHYRVEFASGEPTYGLAIAAAAAGFDAGTNNPTLAMLAVQATEFNLEGVWGQRIYPTRDRAYFASSDLPGLNAGTCTAPNQAATIEKWSWLGTRHGIGSLHIPGIPVDVQENGQFIVAYRNLLQTVADRMKLTYFPSEDPECGMYPVIVNRASKPLSLRMDGTTVQRTVRVMRRRTIGVGK